MKVSIKGFIYHKDAENFQDCFDRYAVNTSNNKFCVSDGVSKSFFPGIWAELLVETFVNTPGAIDIVDAGLLRSIQRKWADKISEIANRPDQKYYVRNFFAQGRSAAATFVGLDFFYDHGKPYWEAFALGDSFLFFIPEFIQNLDNEFNRIIYLSSKADLKFDNFPDFFDSRQLNNKGRIRQIKHELAPGTFYLMTDALSEWLIHEKQTAIDEIKTWRSQSQFEQRMIALRKDQLQNDDAAVLIINIANDNSLKINYNGIDVADLQELSGLADVETTEPLYEREISSIEQKFLNPPNVEDAHDEGPANTIVDDHRRHNQDYLLKRQPPKKRKKRSFWERKIDAIVGMFGPKNLTDNENYVSKDNSSKETLSGNKNDSQDLDSIANKF